MEIKLSQMAPWETKRRLLVKLDEETDPSFGCPPEKRSLEQHVRFGLIDLDKPSGPSSHEVVAWIKRMLGLGHAGHGGTLETLSGSEQSNGHWGPATSSRRRNEGHPSISTNRERICLFDDSSW